MGTRAFAVLVAVVFGGVLGACKSELLPGRCDTDKDCKDGKRCNTAKESGGYGTCAYTDGGTGDADADAPAPDTNDAGDASDAHDAFSCEVEKCGSDTPICDMAASMCRKCSAAAECMVLSPAAPVCVMSGKCVECDVSTDCKGAKPICQTATNTCNACTKNEECLARDKATPGCATGKCVECTETAHCTTAGKLACNTTKNTCVECVANTDCKNPSPICDTTTNTCKPCKADAECTTGPKVCMSHDDGRCATGAETIYVQKVASCPGSAATADGSEAKPYCSMDPAIAAVASMTTRNLIVVRGPVGSAASGISIGTREISIVGQLSAVIAGIDPGLHVTAGDVFVRNVKFGPSPSVGCQADVGSTLRLDHVVVTGNSGGGILIKSAAFDIQNTTVTNNGPGAEGAINWGGILVLNPPAAGPAKLRLVTVQNNMNNGISCSAQLTMASEVLSTGNASPDISPTCGFTSCGTASATCGAQP